MMMVKFAAASILVSSSMWTLLSRVGKGQRPLLPSYLFPLAVLLARSCCISGAWICRAIHDLHPPGWGGSPTFARQVARTLAPRSSGRSSSFTTRDQPCIRSHEVLIDPGLEVWSKPDSERSNDRSGQPGAGLEPRSRERDSEPGSRNLLLIVEIGAPGALWLLGVVGVWVAGSWVVV